MGRRGVVAIPGAPECDLAMVTVVNDKLMAPVTMVRIVREL